MKICAITNVFNEKLFLPKWLSYYGGQIGIENCLVIDDNTTDGSTDDLLGANRIRIPKAPFDDIRRANMISDIANGMLRSYDCVLYSDCDELLVADPRRFAVGILRNDAGAVHYRDWPERRPQPPPGRCACPRTAVS